MANESAKKMYQLILDTMNDRDLKYKCDEEDLSVHFIIGGDELFMPMIFRIWVDGDRDLIRLISPLDFYMSEEKRKEGALATCYATDAIAFGSFDYDISDGQIVFRMAAPYENCDIGKGLIIDMLGFTISTLKRYTEAFFDLNCGLLDIEDFLNGEFS